MEEHKTRIHRNIFEPRIDHPFNDTQLTSDIASKVRATEKTQLLIQSYNLEKSHNAETCEKRDPLGFSNFQFVAEYQKVCAGKIKWGLYITVKMK